MGFKLIDIHSLISNFVEVMRINVPLVKSYYKFFYDEPSFLNDAIDNVYNS